MELLKESRQSKVLEIARLTGKIPEEARRMITGIMNPQEAWERLDERYGDKKLAIMAAMMDLTQLKMPTGKPYKKVEPLVQNVRLKKLASRQYVKRASCLQDILRSGC